VRLAHRWPSLQSAAIVIAAALVIGFLVWPMLMTSSGMAQDWSNHLWYLWRQSVTINRDHQPSLFLNDGGSVFYPFYAFYGGTIYALFGGLAVVLGNAPLVAYVFSYVLGFAAAYGGWYSLARMAGLGRWQAQAPGLLFVTSAYFLTLVYARGDWPEFIAVSILPLLTAAVLRVLLVERLSLRWAILLVGCAIVFFGSHNLTMLWGVTALAISGLAIAVAVPQARRRVTSRGLARVVALVIPAALVNAWYLFPALAYGQRSSIATHYDYAGSLRGSSFLVSNSHLFTFSRASVVDNTPDFVLALPVLAVVWVLLSILISFVLRRGGAWRRVLCVLSALTIGFAVLMTHTGLLLTLPRPYTLLQFSYRLETYVLLGLCGAVLATLALARTWPRRWRIWSWTVVVVLIASGVGAVQQVDSYPRGNKNPGVVVPDRYAVFNPAHQPPFTGGLGDYSDATLPVIEPPGTPVGITFPTVIDEEKVTIPVKLPAGVLVHTNLTGAPYLVSVAGAKVVGRDKSGDMVLEIHAARNSPQQITLSRSNRLPVALGRLVTRLALIVLALYVAVGLVWRFSGSAGPRQPDRPMKSPLC
jgi:hypothetical protein